MPHKTQEDVDKEQQKYIKLDKSLKHNGFVQLSPSMVPKTWGKTLSYNVKQTSNILMALSPAVLFAKL